MCGFQVLATNPKSTLKRSGGLQAPWRVLKVLGKAVGGILALQKMDVYAEVRGEGY